MPTLASPCHTIDAIRRAHTGHWFDTSTMRFFKTRILDGVSVSADGVSYFVTSEPYAWSGPRVYTLRSFDPRTPEDVTTVGEMGAYKTSVAAHRARALAAHPYPHNLS